MTTTSNDDRGPATAADFRDLADRLDVIADDIVLLTRERDEAQAEVARLRAPRDREALAEQIHARWDADNRVQSMRDYALVAADAVLSLGDPS